MPKPTAGSPADLAETKGLPHGVVHPRHAVRSTLAAVAVESLVILVARPAGLVEAAVLGLVVIAVLAAVMRWGRRRGLRAVWAFLLAAWAAACVTWATDAGARSAAYVMPWRFVLWSLVAAAAAAATAVYVRRASTIVERVAAVGGLVGWGALFALASYVARIAPDLGGTILETAWVQALSLLAMPAVPVVVSLWGLRRLRPGGDER